MLDTISSSPLSTVRMPLPRQPLCCGVGGASSYPFYRSLLRFDLSQLPAGAQIVSAKLALVVKSWYYPDGIAPTVALARLGRTFDASAAWSQAAVNIPWAHRRGSHGDRLLDPGCGEEAGLGKNIVDITALASEWATKSDGNHGLRLSVVGPSHSVAFYAADATLNQPSLTIDYLCATAPAPISTSTATPTATPEPAPAATPTATPTPAETLEP